MLHRTCLTVALGFVWAAAGQAKEPTVSESLEQGVVRSSADTKALMDKWVVVLGTLERVDIRKGKGPGWKGTGLRLRDGTVVYLTYRDPPAGWEPLVGKFLAAHGTLRLSSSEQEQSLIAPHLADWSAPEEVQAVGGRDPSAFAGHWVILIGKAGDAKASAVLLVAGQPVYVRALNTWPATFSGRQIVAEGLLSEEKLIPDPVIDARGAISQGAEGRQLVLSAPDYRLDTAAAEPDSIGSATMEKDGTIVLMLRATGPGPAVGDALLRYPPGHPKYQEILSHLGGLKPGESKPVPPFP